MLFGRNYDFGPDLRSAARDLTVMFFGLPPTLFLPPPIGFSRRFLSDHGLNRYGLFLELNMPRVPIPPLIVPGSVRRLMLFDMLLTSPTWPISTHGSIPFVLTGAYTITAATPRDAHGLEWSTFRTVCRRPLSSE